MEWRGEGRWSLGLSYEEWRAHACLSVFGTVQMDCIEVATELVDS